MPSRARTFPKQRKRRVHRLTVDSSAHVCTPPGPPAETARAMVSGVRCTTHTSDSLLSRVTNPTAREAGATSSHRSKDSALSERAVEEISETAREESGTYWRAASASRTSP
eukprot:scaffold187938_cov31-Tisochrysis_lutea.AAC.2